jgi:hypothetical protein
MTLYFRAIRPLRNLPLYSDRFSFRLYLAKDSPKLMYIAGLVGKVCLGNQGRRVLIYGDFLTAEWNIKDFLKVSPSDFSLLTPLTLISLTLQNLGIKTCSLRSSIDAGERAVVINRFNNLNSNVRALVTGLKNSFFGLNLQYYCSDLIIIAVAENVNLILQIIRRIY